MISLKLLKNLIAVLVAFWAALSATAASAGTPSITFDRGYVGEYTSAINGPVNMFALDGGTPDLNIQSVTIT
ncbi:MAG: hypothetical protein NBV60_11140, partial [Erythrobacter sp.]|nr:hypothetical protein [Erythrobacter sp.]